MDGKKFVNLTEASITEMDIGFGSKRKLTDFVKQLRRSVTWTEVNFDKIQTILHDQLIIGEV